MKNAYITRGIIHHVLINSNGKVYFFGFSNKFINFLCKTTEYQLDRNINVKLCSYLFIIFLTFNFKLKDMNNRPKWNIWFQLSFFWIINQKISLFAIFLIYWSSTPLFDTLKLKNKNNFFNGTYFNVLDLGSKIHSLLRSEDLFV
jgi:hypothetical protein